jgi:hypothetical protein
MLRRGTEVDSGRKTIGIETAYTARVNMTTRKSGTI